MSEKNNYNKASIVSEDSPDYTSKNFMKKVEKIKKNLEKEARIPNIDTSKLHLRFDLVNP